jgi:predicted helicase
MVISQHQISTDPRSDIPHNPSRTSPDYTVKLIGKVITVGLEGSSSLPHRRKDPHVK